MPRNENKPIPMETLPLAARRALPDHAQEHWYILAGRLFHGLHVIDVGGGTGNGVPIMLARGVSNVASIDPLPASDLVSRVPVWAIREAIFDVAVCLDVLEHVEEDEEMLANLMRISRFGALISTPNYNTWHCRSPYHVREYTPEELSLLLTGKQYLVWTTGADRITSPVRLCHGLANADACFTVLIRGAECPDAAWQEWSNVPTDGITKELLRYGKCSEEWELEIAGMLAGLPPVDALKKLASWLEVNLQHEPGQGSLDTEDSVLLLRHGFASAKQQRIVIDWIVNRVWKR